MKNFTNNFKQFTSRLSARWLIMALMLLVGTSSAWGANLASGQVIQFKFSQGSVSQNSGWNGTVLNMWDNNGNSEQVNVQPGEVYTISEGHWIPTKFQYLSQYDWSGWKGQTAEIGDCGGGSTLLTNKMYEVTLSTSTDWAGTQYQNYPNKQFKHTLSCEDADLCKPTYYIAGTLPGASWDEGKHLEMTTCDRGLRSLTFNGVAAGNYEFKITQGNWGWSTGSYHTDKGNLKCESSSGNIKISTNGLGQTNITIYFDGTKAYASYAAACFTINDLDITASKTSICDGESVTLTLNNKQSGVTYKIGNTTIFNSNVAKPTYDTGAITGVSSKSYTITAEATNQCKSKSKKIDISINDLPETPQFDAAPSYCAGDNITLPIKDKAGNSVTWYKQDGSAAGTPLNTAGPHTYKAKATNTSGCVSTDFGTYSYTVKQIPVAGDFSLTGVPQGGFTYNKGTQVPEIETTLQGISTITPIYYLGNNKVNTPTDAGTYTVKISVAAGDSYCAMNETEIGTFTINKAGQTALNITNLNTNVCGTTVTVVAEGGSGNGAITYAITADNTDTRDASINPNTGVVTVKSAGSVTVTASKAGDNNYNVATPVSKTFTFTMPIENVNLSIIKGLSASGDYCVGTEIQLQLTYTGATPANDGNHFEWVKDGFSSEIGNNEGGIATGATWTTTLGVNDKTLKVKLKDCNGWVESNELTFNVFERPVAPKFNPNYMTVCQGEAFTLPGSEGEGYIWSDAQGKPTTAYKPSGIDETSQYYAVISFGCPSDATLYTVNVNKIPTITGASVTQTNKEITLESAAGADTEWSVSPTENVTLTDNGDGTATFVATANGDYTITASNGVCAPVSHTIKVSDAFYIWVRNAKESDTAYGQFYYPNENSEAVRGGEMFYAECDALPTKDNYTTYNRGGRKADIVNDDCDGYTWYGFKASADVIAGTKYFYVHATNDISDGGYYTHSKPLKSALSGDVYYTLGTTGDSYSGWNLSTASAPYAGPVVHSLGSTTLGTDKFAALYVTDCSGKEITGYQWYKDGQPYSSVCSYVGKKGAEDSNAGLSNNIRPAEAGNYSCTVTYEDRTTATSAAVSVTGTYSRSFTSNIPVLVVNTGSKGFPDCTGLSGQTASKNASTFKEKRSVDVKIYEGETLVYDRKARMNYRGSSSLNFVKKSYAFCPGDANCEEKDGQADYVKTAKLNMLGVGTACDKDWVLYAAAADPSLMRNRLVFDSYKAMTGKWGVNSRYVELIVDGVYKGVYVFMDKITMNNDRVEVDEDKGFIVKFDKTDREDRVGGLNGVLGDEKTFKTSHTGKDNIGTYDTSIDQRFEIEYPEKDDYKTGWKVRVDGIQGMFQAFEDALKQGDYATVQKYIDYTSWADWFIINEFTKNVDAYRASCIFVYTGEAGAKIEARPLWDQELSFNNQASNGTSDKGSNSTTGLLIQHSNVYSDAFGAPFWFTGGGSDITGGLLSDPCFVQVVKERWNMHQSGALSKKSLEDLIDKYEDDLAPEGTTDNALKRETTFWEGKSRGTCDCSYDTGNATATGYQNKTFAESTGTITNWISDAAASEATGRRAGLTTAINNLKGASFSIQIIPSEAKTTPWEPVEIAVSVTPAGYDYKLEYTGNNNLGSVANTIIKEEGDKITYRIPRPSAWGVGDAEEGRDDIEYGIKATLSVQEGTTVCGSQAAPSSTAKIILQDEDNDNCK